MNQTKVDKLLLKLIENRISEEESEELLDWLKSEENLKYFNDFVEINHYVNAKKTFAHNDELFDQIKKTGNRHKYRTILKYAAVIAGLIVAAYIFKDKVFIPEGPTTPIIVNNEIEPGQNTAVLTLEDGENVTLGKDANYKTQNLSAKEDQIVYSPKENSTKAVQYNYLTVPRGGQFSLTLSDGTVVWLNSESKLKYPVNFVEGESRAVHLVYGEAYFDVSSSTEHQGADFKVYYEKQEIQVLGTQFNIKAYKDEPDVLTTLVEGKVAVKHEEQTLGIVPGEQSRLNTKTGAIAVSEVDVFSETSWKRGVFSFKKKPLKDIMKTLSRWYDMEVVFEKKSLENKKFKGVLRKNQSIEDVLSVIMSSSLDSYEIKNKTVILK
ncbi:FecR family protein [Flagellimonas halotolerans]|uniref:FecR family protein n=1 Tax=Flagellimonas halotolerans TaxID=3112164 RepID=A0ABU6ITU6_9FLAO|nr:MULTISPECIES: FecR family protein [unclassified Allomuricauda]MEC3966603.1 FecR family protein [Muricauda sp. SYSU M86414]MEC4266424.1 FecR family protein [Muricauda sp. SYSU M84420]